MAVTSRHVFQTAHELARILLDGPDVAVRISLGHYGVGGDAVEVEVAQDCVDISDGKF